MITKIVAKLKTGTVKRVVIYGGETDISGKLKGLPDPPYDVVKPEPAFNGRLFRVIAHFKRGQQLQLEDHMREIGVMLSNFQATSRHGCTNRLGRAEITSDIVDTNSDDTISMEAAFLMPTHTF